MVSGITGDTQRLRPECEGLVPLPAKKTSIYVKQAGSAPEELTFHGGVSCSLAADLSPRAEAIKSGHRRPPPGLPRAGIALLLMEKVSEIPS